MESSYILDLNEQNFQSVLQQSVETPVLFNFWANIQPESAELIPILERIAHEYKGALILASIDCEKEQMLAMQFGVQTLPTLALFSKGQPVDGVGGVKANEASIREMIARQLPNQDELTLHEAQTLIAEEDFAAALTLLKPLASSLGETGAFNIALAAAYIGTQQYDLAEACLTKVLMQDQDASYKSLLAKIELFKQASDSPEIRELQTAFEADPNNHNLGFELAVQLNQVNKSEEALSILLSILKKDLNFAEGDVKKTMLDILSSLGQGNETASRFRRQLYALLY